VDQTTGSSGRSPVSVGEEMRRNHCGRRGRGGGYVDGRGLGDRAFVSWTTEPVNVLLVAPEYGRRAALLQTDDVAAETETEIARVVPGHLLGGHVHFAAVPVYR